MEIREDILEEYECSEDDVIITSPGKFEGEPIYAPYFYGLWLIGEYDEITTRGFKLGCRFNLTNKDYELWPELKPYKKLELWVDDNGFVNTEVR